MSPLTLIDLDNDALSCIFSFNSNYELCQIAQTCKRLQTFADSDRLWFPRITKLGIYTLNEALNQTSSENIATKTLFKNLKITVQNTVEKNLALFLTKTFIRLAKSQEGTQEAYVHPEHGTLSFPSSYNGGLQLVSIEFKGKDSFQPPLILSLDAIEDWTDLAKVTFKLPSPDHELLKLNNFAKTVLELFSKTLADYVDQQLKKFIGNPTYTPSTSQKPIQEQQTVIMTELNPALIKHIATHFGLSSSKST